MRTRRIIIDAVVIAASLAVVLAVFLLGRGGARKAGHIHPAVTGVRTLMTGMVIYSQNNRDAFPPPERMTELLVKTGIVPSEIFEPPQNAPEEPAYFVVMVPELTGRWSNSFRECVPVVYANPAFFDGKSTAVVFSDNHVDSVAWADLEEQIKGLKATSVPVR